MGGKPYITLHPNLQNLPHNLRGAMSNIPNDEPTLVDHLDHCSIAKHIGDMIRSCHPPYVIGICGTWGSGKTSFLKKLRAYLGGPWEIPEDTAAQVEIRSWVQNNLPANSEYVFETVWFNPWQHQFEQSPLVALLHEIRLHFTRLDKFKEGAGKIGDVVVYSMVNTLSNLAKDIIPSADSIMKRGREYEAEHLMTPLSSQNFRSFFEDAIETIIKSLGGTKGRLVIFIDDLDRCEGEVAYRLLEALKLYLNAHNCVFVLGIDQEHLEGTIARVLSKSDDSHSCRPLARNYLNKMFQNLLLLPVPKNTQDFVTASVNFNHEADLVQLLETKFGLPLAKWPDLITALDQNLPHNPRKIKSFVSAWKLYLKMLAKQNPFENSFDWRVTIILNYLGQFEEPIFRKIEQEPAFYVEHLERFCTLDATYQLDFLFHDLEIPYPVRELAAIANGGVSALPSPKYTNPQGDILGPPKILSRPFWIAQLIYELFKDQQLPPKGPFIQKHLIRTGKA